ESVPVLEINPNRIPLARNVDKTFFAPGIHSRDGETRVSPRSKKTTLIVSEDIVTLLIHAAVNFASFLLCGLWTQDNTVWRMVWKQQKLAGRAVRNSLMVVNS